MSVNVFSVINHSLALLLTSAGAIYVFTNIFNVMVDLVVIYI